MAPIVQRGRDQRETVLNGGIRRRDRSSPIIGYLGKAYDDAGLVAIETEYGHPFCAAVWRENLFATQFHPEKSQADGLRILKNFASL